MLNPGKLIYLKTFYDDLTSKNSKIKEGDNTRVCSDAKYFAIAYYGVTQKSIPV